MDIKNLCEQNNYTNRYLQTLGSYIVQKAVPSPTATKPSPVFEAPIFKPFEVGPKLRTEFLGYKTNLQRKIEQKMEQLSKLQSTVIPETPQGEASSASQQVMNIEENSQSSESETRSSDLQINNQNWKTPTRLYYPRASPPDILLEERVTQNFKSFSADHIYELNIDGQSETSILQILQQMTMVSTEYQTANDG